MDHRKWIIKELSLLATQLGLAEMPPERLLAYADVLVEIPREKLEPVFYKLRRETTVFPQVPEIREAALGNEQTEALAAWEEAIRFCSKYVDCDPFGNFGPEHGWYKSWPRLSDRILQTVRMTGGWRSLKLMDDNDEPFLRKRFLEAYEHALDVIALPAGILSLPALPEPARKKLPMPSVQPVPAPTIEQIAKPFFTSISNDEWKRRRDEQIEQARKVREKYQEEKKP